MILRKTVRAWVSFAPTQTHVTSPWWILHNVHCTLYNVYWTFYICTLYMYIVQCTSYICTLCICAFVHCAFVHCTYLADEYCTCMYQSKYSIWEMLCNFFCIFCLLYNYCLVLIVWYLLFGTYVLSYNYCNCIVVCIVYGVNVLCIHMFPSDNVENTALNPNQCSKLLCIAFWHHPHIQPVL